MLDLTKAAAQADTMIHRLRDGRAERRAHLDTALDQIKKSEATFESLKHKIAASKPIWLTAGLIEPPARRLPAPPAPSNHTILATDGSHIDVDRHQSARCYLINIGRVRLDYGQEARAELTSIPKLCADKDEMVLSDGLREQAVEGTLLGVKRAVAELDHLAEMSREVEPVRPTLALTDGSLIMWGLANERYPDFVSKKLLENSYLKTMDEIYRLAKDNHLTLASYISFPRTTDVVNALRLLLCPNTIADCERHCQNVPGFKRPCETIAGVHDSDIFECLLAVGERSAIFYNQSQIIKRYGPHHVYFFYLKLAGEVARIEVPEWIASDPEKLSQTHALIWDQCQRGDGYPVALAEAHEQAVVTGTDRANFQQMLEHWLITEHLPQTTSAKSQSKRARWV